MEAFIYRLCYPLWKVGGAASLKRKDPSFITNAASLEYFSPTVGHISDGFSLMLIRVASLGLIKSIKLPNTQGRKALKEEGKKRSQDGGIHTIQSTSAGVGHTDPLKMPDYAT